MNQQPTNPSTSESASGVPADLNHELTKGYAGRFIRFRVSQLAGKFGISRSDRADLEQDLRIALLERVDKFDPERGHWNVFVFTIIERTIAAMFTPGKVEQRMTELEFDSLSSLVASGDCSETSLAQLVLPEDQARISGRRVVDHVGEVDRNHDVAILLERLPPDLREIATLLMHKSVAAVARELDIPRATLRRRIKTIRGIFSELGDDVETADADNVDDEEVVENPMKARPARSKNR